MFLIPLVATAVVAGAAWAALGDVSPGPALAAAVAAAALAVASGHGRLRLALVLVAVGAGAAAHAAHARDRILACQELPPSDHADHAVAADNAVAADDAVPADGVVAASVSGGHGRDRRATVRDDRSPDGVEGAAEETHPLLEIDGVLVQDASVGPDGTTRLLVDLRQVRGLGAAAAPRPADGRVQVYVGGGLAAPAAAGWLKGRAIRAPVTLSRPPTSHNPGGRSPRWQALVRDYQLAGSVKSALLVDVRPGGLFTEAAAAVRRHVRRSIRSTFADRHPQAAAVVAAILIGDRVGLSEETERRLQHAGTYHVIAISGGNVAIMAGLALGLMRLLVRSPRTAATTAVAAVLAYSVVVAHEPSVIRAVTTAVVYLAATALGVTPSPGHVLALAALLIASADPLMTIEPGAWLSYGATLGILLFAGSLTRRIADLRRAGGSFGRVVWTAGIGILAATVAAEAMLLPVSASLFSRVGIAGLLLNFVAIPAMTIVQLAGIAVVVLAALSPPAATVAAVAGDLGVRALVDSAAIVDYLPWLSWQVPPPAPFWVVGFYAALAAATWTPSGLPRRAAVASGTMCLAAMLTSPDLAWAQPRSAWLRLTMLDVGQGESMVVQFPGGRSLLVDAGSATARYDVGRRVVTPALWALGIRRLDWLAITHPDLDHDGGARAVADAFVVREIWEGVPVSSDQERSALRAAAAHRGTSWRQLQAGDRVEVGEVVVDVLHPQRPDWERPRARNDDSMVLRLQYGRVEMLLTGDIGAAVERTLDPDPRFAPLRILKIAHHGSRSSSNPDLIRGYHPVLALVSAGAGNMFGHPAPEVLARLAEAHVKVLRTDRDRAVMIETDGREIRARTWSGLTWRARSWWASS